ncbi:alpha-hydroxy acid oxidase [Bradyrhizobium mercantei]|uniref:alpha-hydroxy acid oxidase n=1 Tax=Bradyrhizobium mercantei TaxID=1904807 RepID=UPI000978C394|nr:alpha-hydroxy acid oxidase [Bradyrhizobium mercantei]
MSVGAGTRRLRLLERCLCLNDFEAIAQRKLPRMLHGFIAAGAETETSLEANFQSFRERAFVPRVLAQNFDRDISATIFGRRYAAPFGIAPMGAAGLCAFDADLALASGAKAFGIPMMLSASSLVSLEEVARIAPGTWYQAYLPGDDRAIEAMIDRVKSADYDILVVTADVPVPANRETNVRNGFSIPLKPSFDLLWQGSTHPGWVTGTFLRTYWRRGEPRFVNLEASGGPPVLSRAAPRPSNRRDRLSWQHVGLIRRRWPGRLVIKGILSPHDARLAADIGADGIIVSNHGGRQLDGAVAPLRVLSDIRQAVPAMTVMLDGGVRRGTDVLKALALGADFVFLGRPFLFAAVVQAEDGVRYAARLLAEEIDRDLALLGLRSLSELSPGLIVDAFR